MGVTLRPGVSLGGGVWGRLKGVGMQLCLSKETGFLGRQNLEGKGPAIATYSSSSSDSSGTGGVAALVLSEDMCTSKIN